jgi:hypothetical protein
MRNSGKPELRCNPSLLQNDGSPGLGAIRAFTPVFDRLWRRPGDDAMPDLVENALIISA